MKKVKIINHSGFDLPKSSRIAVLRRRNYQILRDITTIGDRPKNFIRIYEYGTPGCRRDNPKTWLPYIAKVGDKWYPAESLTEYLLNKIGEILGVEMAKSKLYIIDNQIRFCSLYFLKPYEELVHGAQIYARYLDDEVFVREVEEKKMERDIFSFQEAKKAIQNQFSHHAHQLLIAFVKMMVLDAIIGNNDRHFYNWGVIVDVREKKPPRFAPVFDTARGFFWNEREDRLNGFLKDNAKFQKYINLARPKIGWDGALELNHFEVIQRLLENYPELISPAAFLLEEHKKAEVLQFIRLDMSNFLTPLRVELITKCFCARFSHVAQLFHNKGY